jgi:hypothetical protein
VKRLAFLFIATPCFAQQAPDPALGVCQQISMQKEGQIIQMAVQSQALSKQLDDAKAELAKLKQPPPKE